MDAPAHGGASPGVLNYSQCAKYGIGREVIAKMLDGTEKEGAIQQALTPPRLNSTPILTCTAIWRFWNGRQQRRTAPGQTTERAGPIRRNGKPGRHSSSREAHGSLGWDSGTSSRLSFTSAGRSRTPLRVGALLCSRNSKGGGCWWTSRTGPETTNPAQVIPETG